MISYKAPSPAKLYAAAGAWVLYALLFPLYRWYDFIIAGAVSAAAYFTAKKLRPETTLLKMAEPKQYKSGDAETDALLREGASLLHDIEGAGACLKNPQVKERLDQTVALGHKILAYAEHNPGKIAHIRRFLSYYLPTLQKLLGHYARLVNQDVTGENISGSILKIEEMLKGMPFAFQKQLDSLFLDEALDISSDITALERVMASEGILQSQMKSEKPI